MSLLTADRIIKPVHFAINHLRRGRGKRSTLVVGFDTEAVKGKCRMLQFNWYGTEDDTIIYRPSHGPTAALDMFLEFIDTYLTRKDTEYIIVGWNLQYEWTQLFGGIIAESNGELIIQQSELKFQAARCDASGNLLSRWRITALNDKMFSATFIHLGTKRRVRVIDGMKFYVTSLDKAGKMLGLGSKVTMSKDRMKHLTESDMDDPYFQQYARQDAYLTRRIGENISDMFSEYDVTTCISAPQFASKVFRRHFLNTNIPLPSPDLEQAGLSSYHGGKNGYYLAGPRHMTGMWNYDITSAYPEAMRALPNPETAQWFPITDYVPGRHALYRVTMRYTACRYQGAQEHSGIKLSTGYVEDLWITSYELDAIIAHREAVIIKVDGYEMVGEPGGPLVEYVDTFFELKRRSVGALREAAKLFLNSLYGKFFQKVPIGDVGRYIIDDLTSAMVEHSDGAYDYTAGGLYHPPIASLITGFVRGKIHNLEHKYGSVMTSTDGFFARRRPDPADLGTGLGDITATRGDLSIWRERVYIFGKRGHGDRCKDGCDTEDHRKAALHGFRGSVDDLSVIPLKPGAVEYVATQLVTLRLARRRFTAPDGSAVYPDTGSIIDARYTLDIRGSPPP